MAADELDSIREQIADLRRLVEVGQAETRLRFDNLAAMKEVAHDQFQKDLDDEEYARKHTDATVKNLFELVGRLPTAAQFERVSSGVESLEDKITVGFEDIRTTQQDHENRIENLEEVASDLADWKRWALRTVLTPVLVSVVLLVAVTIAAAKGAF